MERRGEIRAPEATKIRLAAPPPPFPEHEPSCGSGLHACLCVCPHVCTLRGWHVHYLFISPVCQAATLCTSACLTIIMPHTLFNTHADSDADSYRAIYLGYAHLSPCLILSQAVANNCTKPSSTWTCIAFTLGHTPNLHTRLHVHASIHTICFMWRTHIPCSLSPSCPSLFICRHLCHDGKVYMKIMLALICRGP